MYDIIGDVHGHAGMLKKMLLHLGYSKSVSGYSHPSRKAIFVGDFINRGDDSRKTLYIIRNMVDNGNALAVLGNHEIYAILLSLKDKGDVPLVKIPKGGLLSALKTIKEFSKFPDEWKSYLKWMRKLPFFLDLDGIRVVHACWSDKHINIIKEDISKEIPVKDIFRNYFKKPQLELSKAITILTKGMDFELPGDLKIINNKGISPRSFRMRWWEEAEGKTFEEISFESKFTLPSYTIPEQILPTSINYGEEKPPVFFGHYSRYEGPHIIKPNICCIDSWIAGSKTLTAYCWSGEKSLIKENLVQISD